MATNPPAPGASAAQLQAGRTLWSILLRPVEPEQQGSRGDDPAAATTKG